MRLSAHGVAVELLPGWEGSIKAIGPHTPTPANRSAAPASTAAATIADGLTPAGPGGQGDQAGQTDRAAPAAASTPAAAPALMHLANFALPANRGDFGSGAVEIMDSNGIFVSLVEYGPEVVGTALFPEEPFPPKLSWSQFKRSALQRTLAGQAGLQWFFSTKGRAFCLYVVIADEKRGATAVTTVNRALSRLKVDPA